MNVQKRLMILGAGRGQVDLIKAAKRLNIRTIVVTHSFDYPGVALADEVVLADLLDKEAILSAAKEKEIDGIVTCCNDIGLKSLGYVCENLGINGLSLQAAEISSNKLLMKKCFINNNVSTAKFVSVLNHDIVGNVFESLKFPIVLKAVDLQSSRGVFIVNTKEEYLSACKEIMKLSKEDTFIAEEYIDGVKFTVEAFIYKNEIIFILPMGDQTIKISTIVPIGHYAPFEASEDIQGKIEDVVSNAIISAGLNNCAVDLDMILSNNGNVFVIELTGRAGATCIPQIVSTYYGINYYDMIIASALNQDANKIFSQRAAQTACLAEMIISDSCKEFKNIDIDILRNENIVEVSFFVKKGDEIRKFDNASDSIGQVVVKGDSIGYCRELISTIKEEIFLQL